MLEQLAWKCSHVVLVLKQLTVLCSHIVQMLDKLEDADLGPERVTYLLRCYEAVRKAEEKASFDTGRHVLCV